MRALGGVVQMDVVALVGLCAACNAEVVELQSIIVHVTRVQLLLHNQQQDDNNEHHQQHLSRCPWLQVLLCCRCSGRASSATPCGCTRIRG